MLKKTRHTRFWLNKEDQLKGQPKKIDVPDRYLQARNKQANHDYFILCMILFGSRFTGTAS